MKRNFAIPFHALTILSLLVALLAPLGIFTSQVWSRHEKFKALQELTHYISRHVMELEELENLGVSERGAFRRAHEEIRRRIEGYLPTIQNMARQNGKLSASGDLKSLVHDLEKQMEELNLPESLRILVQIYRNIELTLASTM